MKNKIFPRVQGVVVKKTKNGQRYLLHDKDIRGRDIYVTIQVVDTDGKKEYLEKVKKARIKLKLKKSESTFQDLIDEYIKVRQLRANTVRALKHDLEGFSLDDDANRKKFLALLEKGQKSIDTRRSKISSFFRWLILCKRIDVRDPTEGARLDKARPRKRIMTDAEQRIFFARMRKESLDVQLCLRLAFYTGARISTILRVDASTLNDGKLALYNVKCRRPYAFPVPLTDRETIKIYQKLAQNEHFFTYSPSTIQNKIYAFFRRNFPPKDGETLTVHSLRHTLATRMIRAGVSPDIIARILDHSSVSTTLGTYAKHSETQINSAFETVFGK